MRNIAIITGSRAEYGYTRKIMDLIKKDPKLSYSLIVTNTHLLKEFGNSINEIKKDGYKISAKIYNTYDGYNNITMVKSLASFLHSLPEVIDDLKVDIILVAGDRGEQLMAALTGAHMNIPVAHIQAGELSGNIDGLTRHSITKFAHIHFASNKDAAKRVEKMGEQKFRIYNTGAPQLDELYEKKILSKKEVSKKFNLDINKPIFLVVQHPTTEEAEKTDEQMIETMKAIRKINEQTIIIYPNTDAGNIGIREIIKKEKTDKMKIYRNMKRIEYLSLMKHSNVLIGNSSSGILEAPTYKLPVVNIGDRQKGRIQANNIINVKKFESEKIYKAIILANKKEFKDKIKNCKNPYGDGKASERILKILKEVKIDEKLLCKEFTY